MTKGNTAAVILAAGLGTRMKSALPKVLHPLAGRPMINHLLDGVSELAPERTVVVIGRGMEAVAEAVAPCPVAVQERRLGTADAVKAAQGTLGDFDGDVLVLFGADPLISPETLSRLLAARRGPPEAALAVLGFRPDDPGHYGRLVVGADGSLDAIVEAGEATPGELAGGFCNSGVMAIDAKRLWGLLEQVGNDNAKGEYYLTDIVAIAKADGLARAMVEDVTGELVGIDSRTDLARAEEVVQERLRARAMAGGATLLDPKTVYLSFDTRIGRDVVIGPSVVFGQGVVIGDGVEIRAFSHIEGAYVAPGAVIGPFARLRPGTEIAEDARIGNFVEVKNAKIEGAAKVSHLAYIGDARVGEGANVGAGTITCNYDGVSKHRTDIGAGAFIGSNAALVAPVSIGEGAIIGAGSVITRDVPADALALTRTKQREIKGGAERVRRRKRAAKPAKAKTSGGEG